MVALTQQNLPEFAGRVELPRYDRSRVTPGIVHIGVGGFHRAHQAHYLDALLNAGESLDFGILGVGLLPGDAAMRDVLAAQDFLYTLVAKSPSGRWEARVIGSLVGHLYAPDDPEAVVAALADPAIRIVSLTITEGGYNVDQVTGEFIADDPRVRADLAPGASPSTVFGYLCEGLRRRRERGVPPFTVLSCDNILGNGAVARTAVRSFARLRDPELADWIEAEVRFPSSMVDRITPQTTDADRADVAARFGVDDGWPVVTESFCQWALTDDFPTGRPAYERVGVQLVDDVVPFERMKLRLLNCSHQAIAYLGRMIGFEHVHEAMADPAMRAFVRGFMDREATPLVGDVPGVDLDAYKDTLIERFSNADVRDTVARLCVGGSDHLPKWFVPMVRERLAAGGDVPRLAAITAAWAKFCEGTDDAGRRIEVDDNAAAELAAAAARHGDDPLAFLRQPQFFGDLVDEPAFTRPYLAALASLRSAGAAATLRELARLP